ncbi:MAG: ArnT family glycosyltransferase [Acidobacteriota bacterium]
MELFEATGMMALIITILILVVALRLGRALFSLLASKDASDQFDTLLFSIGLGLGLISLATFVLGAVGLLYRPVFGGILVVALAVSIPGLIREFRTLRGKAGGRASSWLSYPVLGLLVGIGAVCLLAALAPETGFDALNYHLGTPRLYMAHHRIVETVNLAGYSHPLAIDMLYLFAWLIHSSLAARLIHLAFGLLTAAGCLVFCRRYAAPGSGSLAALLFLASPVVMYLCQTAYVDLGLAFFALSALFAVFRWLESGSRHWILLAGVYSGLSLGAKYMGAAVVVMTLAIALAGVAGKTNRRRMVVDLCLYGAVTFLVFAPWIIKNWITSGNPFSPALSDVIPTEGFSSPDYERLVQLTRSWHGYSGGLLDWILIPWRQTFRPDIFHGSPGLAYLALFPIAAVLSWRDRWLRLAAVGVGAGYVFLALGTATTRFFVLVFPVISVLIAGTLWPRPGKRRDWGRQLLVVLALALVVAKLPWSSTFWATPEPLILDTAKVRVFGTAQEREEFQEAKALGPGGNQFYEYLQDLPRGTRILALTPVYQALTDHEVFMPPNSTPSSEMSSAAIDLARSGMSMEDVELNLDRPDVTGRYWKVQLNASWSLTPDETHPRLFYIENGIPMEIAVYGISLRSPAQGIQEVVADLGAPCRVERVTLLRRVSPVAPAYRVFGSPGWSESDWKQVPTSLAVGRPQSSSRRLLELLARNRITHVVLGHHAGANFLPEFYVKRRGVSALIPVRTFGNYEVLKVDLSSGRPASFSACPEPLRTVVQ